MWFRRSAVQVRYTTPFPRPSRVAGGPFSRTVRGVNPTVQKLRLLAAFVAAPAFVLSALRFGIDPVALRDGQPMMHRETGYVGAAACLTCHPDQHASWRKTYHSTMTQPPTRETVAAPFDATEVLFFGKKARAFVGDGGFFMDLPTPTGGRRTAEVALTVGSHRYQQYFERVQRGVLGAVQFRRLPILWHLQEKRWLHINGIFLDPDNKNWPGPEDGAIWNENCIFCHNTGPRPPASRSRSFCGCFRLSRTGREGCCVRRRCRPSSGPICSRISRRCSGCSTCRTTR